MLSRDHLQLFNDKINDKNISIKILALRKRRLICKSCVSMQILPYTMLGEI